MHPKRPTAYWATPHNEGTSCWNVITSEDSEVFKVRLQRWNIAWHLTGTDWGLSSFMRYVENKTCASLGGAGHIPEETQKGMAMETELLTYSSGQKLIWKLAPEHSPRPRCSIWANGAPQGSLLNFLKCFWKTKLGLKKKWQNCFTLESRLKLKDIFIAFGKDFKWATFQKESIIRQMSGVDPSSRGGTGVMVWFCPWSWVALPGAVVIRLQAQNTRMSQASDTRRARSLWCFWSNSEAFLVGGINWSASGPDT